MPDEVASRRLQELFALQNTVQRELNETLVGETMEVLVTGWCRGPGTQTGRTRCHRVVNFTAPPETTPPLGALLDVRIEAAFPHSLVGATVPA